MVNRVLHISPSYQPAYIYGGPTLSVTQLCETQASSGLKVEVFTTTANGPDDLPLPAGIVTPVNNVCVTYFCRYTGDHTHLAPGLWWALWKRCREFDAVHIHSWLNFPTLGAVVVCFLKGIRPVLSPRGTLQPVALQSNRTTLKKIFHLSLGRWLLHLTKLHATSITEAKELRNLFPQTPCAVIPNIIKLPNTKVESLKRSKDIGMQLLFLSRIHPIKGLPLLLDGLAQVDFPWYLTIAGSGKDEYLSKLKMRVKQLDLEDRIDWIGHVEEPRKWEVLTQHDLLVLPSHSENFANVVIESLAVGTPVLISDKVGIQDYVLEKQLGWICKLSAKDITHQLTAIWQDKHRLAEIRTTAPGIIRHDFDPQVIAEKYLAFYEA